MSINTDTFITDAITTVDTVINHFVHASFMNLVQNNHGVITLCMTLYIVWLGYRFMMHSLPMDLNTVNRLILLIMVYALVTQWNLFYTFIYNIFTNEPGEIMKSMSTQDGASGAGVYNGLNAVYSQGMKAAWMLFGKGGNFTFDSIRMYFFGFLVVIATCAGCLVALAYIIYAKMAVALMIFLAPIFLLFLLWESTRELFNKWLQTTLNYALIPVIVCGILMMILSVINETLPGLSMISQNNFLGIIPFVGLMLISALLFTQVPTIASALGGGIALTGVSAAIPLARNALKMSSIPTTTKFAGKAAKSILRK
jgi:type IV secretion system protein VirB6